MLRTYILQGVCMRVKHSSEGEGLTPRHWTKVRLLPSSNPNSNAPCHGWHVVDGAVWHHCGNCAVSRLLRELCGDVLIPQGKQLCCTVTVHCWQSAGEKLGLVEGLS